MKQLLLILTLITTITACYGQSERHLKEFFKRSKYIGNSKKLNKFEPALSKNERKKLFEKFIRNEQDELGRKYEVDTSEIHYIDINNDEFVDIIYTPCLGTCDVTIYYGEQDSFRLVLDTPPTNFLKELKFVNRKCVEVVVESVPYVDQEHSELVYKLVQDSFELQSSRWSRDCTVEPSKFYKEAVLIKILTDSCPLRENPIIGKGECFFEDGDYLYNKTSNITGQFNKNTEGLCWAEKRDDKNLLWFLVELPLKDKILTKDEISYDQSYSNNYYIGWVQATLVQKITKPTEKSQKDKKY